ncbi:MAG: hypothetical protein L6425_00615 [Candidatus Aminicenantes bacterium]|nr:hypothetical protein [Candidatus Aminicenantes bacterium]
MRKNNKRTFWVIVCLLGFFMLALAMGCGKKEQPALRMFLRGNVFINGSRVSELTIDIPLYAQCAFFFPKQDRELDFAGLEAIKPILINEKGQPTEIQWTLLPPGDTALKPGQIFSLFWTADSAPPPGKYSLTVHMPDKVSPLRRSGISGVKIEPAYLTIHEGTADAALAAFYERRILLLKGEMEKLLEKIISALAEEPDNPNLRLELVDALAFSGDEAQAAEEMMNLITAVERKQKELNPGEESHIPDWMLLYLEKLRRK